MWSLVNSKFKLQSIPTPPVLTLNMAYILNIKFRLPITVILKQLHALEYEAGKKPNC